MKNLFEYYIENDKFHLKYAKGEPSVKEQEFHDYYEFVFFIKGNSCLISKNIQQELSEGSIVLIPREHFHQFSVSNPENYTRCILGFRDTPKIHNLVHEVMDTIKVIAAPCEKIYSVFYNLIEIAESNFTNEEKCLFIQASLIHLLIYFKQYTTDAIRDNVSLSPIVSQALAIIDEKYTENLSVEYLANLLYISPSTLAHKFSKELNISLYRYITKKRLSVAHELVQQGNSLTNAALSCGFNDYSCFYRLYKKYYNTHL